MQGEDSEELAPVLVITEEMEQKYRVDQFLHKTAWD
jgi:hypothetical protein